MNAASTLHMHVLPQLLAKHLEPHTASHLLVMFKLLPVEKGPLLHTEGTQG